MRANYLPFALTMLVISTALAAPPRPTPVTIKGTAYGGQQPVANAHVYLFSPAASSTPGAASMSLITPGGSGVSSDSLGYYVLTNASGGFTLTGLYRCQPSLPVYVYAYSGNPGFSGYANNTAIAEMAYLGVCNASGSLPSNLFVNVTEVTTVATIYAIAGFATDPLHISYSGSSLGLQGITNAFATANNMINLQQGTALTAVPSGNAAVPQRLINTLADALATCVNTTSPSSSGCTSLFNATTPGTASPVDVATATMNMAQYPSNATSSGMGGVNIQAIFNNVSAAAPFQPTVASAPQDVTLRLTYSGGGLSKPYAVALDGSGNAWVASQPTSGQSNGSVVEIANASTMLNGTTYLSPAGGWASSEFGSLSPYSIAVDPTSSTVWVGTNHTIEALSTGGTLIPGSPFVQSVNAYSAAVDGSGSAWFAADSSVYKVSTSGVQSPANGYQLPSGTNAAPNGIAIDPSGNVWVGDDDPSSNDVVGFGPGGQLLGQTITAASINSPDGLAIGGGNLWIVNSSGPAVATKYSLGQGVVVGPASGYSLTTSNFNAQESGNFISMDGTASAWIGLGNGPCASSGVTSSNANCIGTAAVNSNGGILSGPSGYTAGGYTHNEMNGNATNVAVDGSGNEWVTDNYGGTVTEIIGVAVPVITPIAAGISSQLGLGVRP